MFIENLTRKEIKSLKHYIPGQTITDVQKKYKLQEIYNLSTNESALEPSFKVQDALKKELTRINQYPDGGSTELRKEIALRYKISSDMVIVTNGGDDLLYLLAGCFISPEDEVILGEYGFSTYEIASTMYGAKIIKVPLRRGFLDLPKIVQQITLKTKMIFLCNPYNPDGTVFSQQELENILNKIPDNIIIVLDEAYIDFVEAQDFPQSVKLIKEKNQHIVSLRTFSKIGGIAGLRVGFGIANHEIINCLRRVQQPYSVNRLAQTAARAFLSDSDYRDRLLQNNKRGKKYLYQQFDNLKLFYNPTQTNFIFVDTQKDADIICEKLTEKGIIVRSGKVWGKDTWIRVTIGTEIQNKFFIKVLATILQENN